MDSRPFQSDNFTILEHPRVCCLLFCLQSPNFCFELEVFFLYHDSNFLHIINHCHQFVDHFFPFVRQHQHHSVMASMWLFITWKNNKKFPLFLHNFSNNSSTMIRLSSSSRLKNALKLTVSQYFRYSSIRALFQMLL